MATLDRGKAVVERYPHAIFPLCFACFASLIIISFMGYRYISLSSEYSLRNLMHLDAVNSAITLLDHAPDSGDFPAAELAGLVKKARDQAVWCLENLNAAERRMVGAMGLSGALELCEVDRARADKALFLIAGLAAAPDTALPDLPAAFRNELTVVLDQMQIDSRVFAPFVTELREGLVRTVRLGTLIASVVLFVAMLLLARTFWRNWQSLTRQADEVVRQSTRFELAMKSNPDGFALLNRARRLVTCNSAFRHIHKPDEPYLKMGMTLHDLVYAAAKGGLFASCPPDMAYGFAQEFPTRLLAAGAEGLMFELDNDRHARMTLIETRFGDSLLSVRDLTTLVRRDREQRAHAEAMRKASEHIEHSARLDPLTNLPNRRALDNALQARVSEGMTALVRIDLDRFKQVNDVFGHEAGDHVLRSVADILRNGTREDDLPARVGGDEFVILCAPGTTEQEAVELAWRIMDMVLTPVLYQGKQCVFGASFGVATTDGCDSDPSGLLSAADAALYQAKTSGRGTVEVFTPTLRKAAARDRAIAEAFVPGLQNGEFVPFGQSIHYAHDMSVAGVEMLARWQHPEFGLLTPHDFLHVARQMGMEADLDAAVFHAGFATLEMLPECNLLFPRISFNVSAGRLLDPKFLEVVRKKQTRWRGCLAFEILETISIDQGPEILRGLEALKETGVEIDVDDFGSGHASINSVMKIGPNTVKIDRDIVAPLGFEPQAEKMVATIIEMGKAMEVTIVAEGVETEYQAEFLRNLGAHKLQGFYFSRPMPLDQLASHVRSASAA